MCLKSSMAVLTQNIRDFKQATTSMSATSTPLERVWVEPGKALIHVFCSHSRHETPLSDVHLTTCTIQASSEDKQWRILKARVQKRKFKYELLSLTLCVRRLRKVDNAELPRPTAGEKTRQENINLFPRAYLGNHAL